MLERAIPLAGLIPTLAILLLALIPVVWWLRSWPARFLVVAIWLRFVFDACAIYTVRPVFAGLSWNAIGSIVVVAVGAMIVSLRYLRWTVLVPVYMLLAAIALSSFVNHMPAAMIEQGTKFGYLLLIMIGAYQALRTEGPERFSAALLVAFTPPLAFLVTSLIFGVSKSGESDGSVSYIGGFFHEAVFSVSVAGGLVAVAFARKLHGAVRALFIAAAVAALLLANYRTTMVAMLPLLLYFLASAPVFAVRREARALVLAAVLAVGGIAVMSVSSDLGPRVQSVIDFAAKPSDFIRRVDTFTRQEKSEASGRAYVWSQYAQGFREGTPFEKLVGHGPDSWETVFPVYAQNTLLSYLYEFGVLGAVAAVLIWIVMFIPVLRAPWSVRPTLLLLHLSFLILNMSTMPFWLIEGLIMYGLICGYTVYYSQLGSERVRDRTPARRGLRQAIN
jgi:hypothetical protein